MDKQKQIKEIKNVLVKAHLGIRTASEDANQNRYAKALYNANCRILDENSVVLSKEEYGKLKAQVEDLTIYNKDYKFRNQELQKANEDLTKNIEELELEADELRDKLAQARKQAITEVLEKISNTPIKLSYGLDPKTVNIMTATLKNKIDEIANEFKIKISKKPDFTNHTGDTNWN